MNILLEIITRFSVNQFLIGMLFTYSEKYVEYAPSAVSKDELESDVDSDDTDMFIACWWELVVLGKYCGKVPKCSGTCCG